MDKFQYGFLMAVLSLISANQLIIMAGYTVYTMPPTWSDLIFLFTVASMGTAAYFMSYDGFSWLHGKLSKKDAQKQEIHKMTPEKMKQIEETLDYIREHYPHLNQKDNDGATK